MSIRSASLILPCHRLQDFPTHLTGQMAAELLAAWTVLWHPALLAATGRLPGWHSADAPPEPETLDGELILVPSVCHSRLVGNWRDRLRETEPRNPPAVEAAESRGATLAAALAAAGMDEQVVAAELAGDFFALGYAHLQVELLTGAMHYSSVLDTTHFSEAVIAAAQAAVAGEEDKAREELARAFDLLMDARNHAYAVDFYVVDVTLVTESTLGEALRAKLASGLPTSLLASGELIERMASDEPATLTELRRAMEAGTACVAGGMLHGGPTAGLPPEAILAESMDGQDVARFRLGRDIEIFGQFDSAFSPLLPQILRGTGFRGTLHAAFDGGTLPKAAQRKTRWGPRDGEQIDIISATPLDVARPETWLKLAEKASHSIAHDHVAAVLLAGWPGQASEFGDDLRRAAKFCPVLGKLVTLEEFFSVTREIDDWSSFHPIEYTVTATDPPRPNCISSRVEKYRRDVASNYQQLVEGLGAIVAPSEPLGSATATDQPVVLNPWNFACSKSVDGQGDGGGEKCEAESRWIPDVPACGYVLLSDENTAPPPVPLAEGRILRNERLEVVVSEATGGIQSLRMHSDRRTRVSQRLVYYDERTARRSRSTNDGGPPQLDTQMIADRIEITRNDAIAGEITSRGRLLDAAGEPLAQFTQAVRLLRGLSVVIVDVELDLQRRPEGSVWKQYFASRLAWSGDALSVRRGIEWVARPTTRTLIEAPEWVEVSDFAGRITCFGGGLPLHRLASDVWLDTLLVVAGEECTRFQFAIGLGCANPTQAGLALLTDGQASVTKWPSRPAAPQGWFLHVGAKNVIVTHIEPLAGEQPGIRLRLLETEGRAVQTKLAAFRPLRAAQTTDFLGQPTGVLSVVDGQARLDIGPYRWLQIEAEWE
jgi:alpha-mannosidase